jgi:hypothetical protein
MNFYGKTKKESEKKARKFWKEELTPPKKEEKKGNFWTGFIFFGTLLIVLAQMCFVFYACRLTTPTLTKSGTVVKTQIVHEGGDFWSGTTGYTHLYVVLKTKTGAYT